STVGLWNWTFPSNIRWQSYRVLDESSYAGERMLSPALDGSLPLSVSLHMNGSCDKLELALRQLQGRSRWLLTHASNVTSQCGEDGIISAALDILPDRTGWCIEFGAWDGNKYSNTYNLIATRGYRGVFIEADPNRFCDLQRNHDSNTHILLNAFVGFGE